jgi:hypothetical protein
MTTCWYCNSELPETSQYCPSCGHSQLDRTSSPLFGVVDPVTGIWNSKFISALVGQEANRAVRYHRPLSVLTVELDHAEHIHKELEQIQIEGLLREMAERLGQAAAFCDRPARDRQGRRGAGGGQDSPLHRDPRLLDQRQLAPHHGQLRRGHHRLGLPSQG